MEDPSAKLSPSSVYTYCSFLDTLRIDCYGPKQAICKQSYKHQVTITSNSLCRIE